MKVSELIRLLQEQKEKHGDNDVAYNSGALSYNVESVETETRNGNINLSKVIIIR